MNLKDIEDWFDSEEGKRSVLKFWDKINKEEEIKTKQLERFHRIGNLMCLSQNLFLLQNKNLINTYNMKNKQ